jgi:RNA polymerase sigma-70 factor (ECF subfamily)
LENQELENLTKLLINAQNGDRKAYTEFLDLLIPEIKKIVKAKTQHNREDIIQDILISVHNAKSTFDPSRPFYPWFYSICSFRIADQKRVYWRNTKKISNFAEQLHNPEHDEIVEENKETIHEAINSLPQKQREIVTLLKLEGYSIKEIAERMNLTVAAVKITAHRAYEALRTKLTEEYSK